MATEPGIVVLYAAFDRWADHQSPDTPPAKTIPTLIALMADWSRFNLGPRGSDAPVEPPETAQTSDPANLKGRRAHSARAGGKSQCLNSY